MAVLSFISGQTGASVGVNAIDAGGAVRTSAPEMTLVDVDLATLSLKTEEEGEEEEVEKEEGGGGGWRKRIEIFVVYSLKITYSNSGGKSM